MSNAASAETSEKLIAPLGGTRAWAIWLAAVAVYIMAVFHRASLGVAGIMAAERFGISSAQLATFAMVQLVVYAAMQIPVGAMLDHYGSKKLLVGGTLLMTAGQVWFAFAHSFAAGLAGRVLVGMGDAMVFVCVLRIAALWFPPLRAPMVIQFTGFAGQIGALLAAGPLAMALHGLGWQTTYIGAAGIGVVVGAIMWVIVVDTPQGPTRSRSFDGAAVWHGLVQTFKEPGTLLGFSIHFIAQFTMNVFVLLWGYPFLTKGEGLSSGEASAMLSIVVVVIIVASPVMGMLNARYPHVRTLMVAAVVGAAMFMWTVVLAWPGHAPLWVIVLLCIAIALGGPGSMVGFDVARSFNPASRIGTANGIVNVGGFVASVLCILLIGIVLDHVAPAGPDTYDFNAFRAAMCSQYVVWAIGFAMLAYFRRRTHRVIVTHADDYSHLVAGVSKRKRDAAGL